MRQFDRTALRELLFEHFDEPELKELLFDLGISRNAIGGETGGALIEELVLYMERRGRMMELVEAVRGKRPFLFK